jgi:hypothetical protein
MTNLDSIKIEVPNDCILQLGDRFVNTQSFNSKETQTKNISTLNGTGVLGYKSTLYDHIRGVSIFELSAKILGENYPKGINLDTIHQVAETINNSKLITIDPYKFIETAIIHKIDITDNLRPDVLDKRLFNTLATLPVNKKYDVTHYNQKTNLGVTYRNKAKTVRDRLIFYCKTTELIKDKELKKQPYAAKVFNQLKGVLRVESNHSQHKEYNHLYGSKNLLDILGSDVKVNYDKFTKLTNKTTDLVLFPEFEGMKYKEIIKYGGFKYICESCNMDWQLIDKVMRIYNPGNYYRDIDEVRAWYNTHNQNTRIVDFDVIKHIKELLYAA